MEVVGYCLGDNVRKEKGDYFFEGKVVGVITKLSGAVRYVVENKDGVLHIFAPQQLRKVK